MLSSSYFGHLEKALLAQAEASGSLESSTAKGRARESLVRTVLVDHLPGRLSVLAGEMFDTHGRRSGEVDVVVVDSNSPAFGIGGEALAPVEAVVAACEVKSDLAGKELESAISKIRSIKELERGTPQGFFIRSGSVRPRVPVPPLHAAGYIVAFRAPSLDTIIRRIQDNPEWFAGDVMRYGPDMICVLDRGMILKNDMHMFSPDATNSEVDYLVIEDAVALQKLVGAISQLLARYGRLTYDILSYFMK